MEDRARDIINVSEQRQRIEGGFLLMKQEFSSGSVPVQGEEHITAHFLVCYLTLLIERLMERELGGKYTCEEILDTLRGMNFADIEGQGYMPLYKREKSTDDLHGICGFRTDYQFITRRKMREIQKKSKGRE